jgi:hypothetical protein
MGRTYLGFLFRIPQHGPVYKGHRSAPIPKKRTLQHSAVIAARIDTEVSIAAAGHRNTYRVWNVAVGEVKKSHAASNKEVTVAKKSLRSPATPSLSGVAPVRRESGSLISQAQPSYSIDNHSKLPAPSERRKNVRNRTLPKRSLFLDFGSLFHAV